MKLSSLGRLRTLASAAVAGCALIAGSALHAQPFVNAEYPDGAILFQPTNSAYVQLISGAPLSAFTIYLTATNTDGSGTSNVLTAGHGMTTTVSGSETTATFPLATNTFYRALIVATDSGGTLTATNTFDTMVPAYTWESEDYDYGGGKFIDNPQTNEYMGLYAMPIVDAFNPNAGGAAYRPVNDGVDTNTDLGNETSGDIPRAGYSDTFNPGTTNVDYDQGWNNGGSGLWGNYTRHYPAGKWNIYGRMAGSGSGPRSAIFYEGGTNGTVLGQFNVPNTGNYQIYSYTPLANIAGDPIEWDTDGSAKTLTIQVIGGGYNGNFYMLVPINPNAKPKPFVSNVSPDPLTSIFANSNVFTFVANSTVGIQQSNIVLSLNGVTPNGVTFSGTSRSTLVSVPIQSNVVYNINITLTDANGSSTYSASLGTFSPANYTWECEDWDHDGGQYKDNPQTDGYRGLAGSAGVDAANTSGGNSDYRTSDGSDLGNETCGDTKRAQYVTAGVNDYDVGWTAAGQWGNYTRTFPAGVYNLYMRSASPSGQNDTATMLWVTNGAGTSDQGLSKIGQFNAPNTGGWQNWSWSPCVDGNGNPVLVTNSGSVKTIRMNEDNGGFNGNFFMLVPPDANRPTIAGLYPNGHAQFQRTNSLSFTVNSLQPLTSSAVTLIVNGVVQKNAVFGGTGTAMTVSWPNVQPDSDYSVSIVVNTPSNDSATTSFTFDTFSSAYYTWEAEDFDYNDGLFFDNPQVDSYFNAAGDPGIDCNNNSQNNGAAYRFSDAGDLSTEVCGDALRTQYITGGTNDYDVGWTAAGNWANYTRNFPKGAYNVYFRVANPSALASSDTFWQVTGGLGTADQTTNLIGHIDCPNTGGYQNWTFTPLLNSSGGLAVVNMTGGKMTFKVVQAGGSPNMNYFILVPVGAAPNGPVLTVAKGQDSQHLVISWTPTGNTLYSSPTVGPGSTWSVVGTANPATVTITGTAQFFYVGK